MVYHKIYLIYGRRKAGEHKVKENRCSFVVRFWRSLNSITAVRRLKFFKGFSYRCVKIRISVYQKVFQIGITEQIAILSTTLLSLSQKHNDMSVRAPGLDYIRLLENSDMDLCLTADLPLEISGPDPALL